MHARDSKNLIGKTEMQAFAITILTTQGLIVTANCKSPLTSKIQRPNTTMTARRIAKSYDGFLIAKRRRLLARDLTAQSHDWPNRKMETMNDECVIIMKRVLSFISSLRVAFHAQTCCSALCNLSIKRFMLLANYDSFGLDIFVRYPQHDGGKNVLR